MKAVGSPKRKRDDTDDDGMASKTANKGAKDGGNPSDNGIEEGKKAPKAKAKKSPEEKALEVALKVCKDIKSRLQKSTSSYDSLCKSVAAGTDWTWADDDVKKGVVKPLQKAQQLVEKKHTRFSRRFVLEDERQLKKDYNCAQLTKELNSMAMDFKDALGSFEFEINCLNTQQSERRSAAGK